MEAWLTNNNLYLGASLEWLRLRLQKVARNWPVPSSQESVADPSTHRDSVLRTRFSKWLGADVTAQKNVRPLSDQELLSLDERIAQATKNRDAAAAKMDPPPALLLLADRFGLSHFERDTLLLCASVEFDPCIASLCGMAQGSKSRNYPTFSLALWALDEPRWDAMSVHRPLRYARLVEINQPSATPLTASPLRVDERIINFLKGLNAPDERLSLLLTPVAEDPVPLVPSHQAILDRVLQRLGLAASESVVPVLQFVGADAGSKLAIARQVCTALHRRLYRLGVETLPVQRTEIETLARLWQRESVLLPVALYLDAENLDGISQDQTAAFHWFLSREVGLVFVGVREPAGRLNCARYAVEVSKPTPLEQREAWVRALETLQTKDEAARIAQLLAGHFNLNLEKLHEGVRLAAEIPADDRSPRDHVWQACRELVRPRLDALAQRLEPKATWEDLVLAEEPLNLLRQIAGQVCERNKVYEDWGFAKKMNRGFGINALFTGETGTGKTMAAEVIANELRLDLYRIDLSAVVSKYIGETEKNLRKLFEAAEQGGAILFFDEADALFGKRSEVKDSHDRYANIEINYLLQRMEAFSGLAILATNMKSALDQAFMRRLRFVVNFQFPSVRERKAIWEKSLPAEVPRDGLDFDRLARLNLAGGNIHSIALNAAFLAAQNGQMVTMQILLTAARTELRKLEKGFSELELR